ncbi:hypothetical protein BSKO_07601 [Bryopsis sp. KO-2023]|nr:hypothetical protein BSKO_07601 [Bryopsis sp. KO-2023]
MGATRFATFVVALLAIQEFACVSANRRLLQGGTLAVSTTKEFTSYPVSTTRASFVVTIQAPKGSIADRAAVSVTAVLDRSGSMSGSKIQLLKKSTEFLVEKLQGQDSLGIVSYASDVREDGRLARVTPAVKTTLRDQVRAIAASGATNLSGGLFKGIDQQNNADIGTGNVKSVILFTDGLPTAGIRDINQIVNQMKGSLDGEVPPTVYTLGFGNDHDSDFLMKIADAGKGQYVFVNDETKIAPVFGEILGGLLTVTAQNIEATLTPLSGASITSVKAGGIVDPSPSSWKIKFADLFADETRDILVDMSVPAGSATSNQNVLRVDVKYRDPKTGAIVQRPPITVGINRNATPQSASAAPNEKVEVTRLRFAVAEDIETAVEKKENGDTAGATQTLDNTLSRIGASSANGNSDVQALKSDVQRVRGQVAAPQELAPAAVGQITSNAQALGAQRAVVSGGGSFASNQAGTTGAKLSAAADATQFVGGGGAPSTPVNPAPRPSPTPTGPLVLPGPVPKPSPSPAPTPNPISFPVNRFPSGVDFLNPTGGFQFPTFQQVQGGTGGGSNPFSFGG